MATVSFRATVGADRTIRVPDSVELPPGAVEVTVTAAVSAAGRHPAAEGPKTPLGEMLLGFADEFARIAADTGIDLPADMVANQTWYALHPPE